MLKGNSDRFFKQNNRRILKFCAADKDYYRLVFYKHFHIRSEWFIVVFHNLSVMLFHIYFGTAYSLRMVIMYHGFSYLSLGILIIGSTSPYNCDVKLFCDARSLCAVSFARFYFGHSSFKSCAGVSFLVARF